MPSTAAWIAACGLVWLGAGAALAADSAAATAQARSNAFDDPFFQISAAIPACPLPMGPFVTEEERRSQAHSRAERGTSCWLGGDCDKSNAYAYDRPIASAIRERLAAGPRFTGSSLWVTVQRRFVFVEGCVPPPAPAMSAEIEAFVRAVPQVQLAIVNVYSDPSAKPPYRVRPH